MYRTMLVPLDGSKLAEVVFHYASNLAGKLDLDLVLLHVSDPAEADLTSMHWAYVERAAEMLARQASEVRRKAGRSRVASAVKALAEVVSGDAAEEIARYAEGHAVDLILMATHGRSGMKRWVLGSVADKVLRSAKVPVWLVRAPPPPSITPSTGRGTTILVPLDGSKLAESALPHVEALAKQWSDGAAEVVLLTVCGPPELLSMPEYYLTPDTYPPTRPLKWEDYVLQQEARCKEASQHYLEQAGGYFKRAGINTRCEVLSGNAAEAIVDYAARNPFDLMVMCTHGRSGISRWAFGSVADKVLRGVSTPILLIRPS
ncbi:MAG: universal stress protein [Chloroflexi bacterium]|nr:universal stress protein [Chloroflexota bacterium]